ncbi:MAG: carboxypeptidase-like regulatory domain-containing protein, partial [Prevotellaceae bacterium]|nr:carboxypeptidase-like regulatory domain-containing protein [Prevotellaceae bacterium]
MKQTLVLLTLFFACVQLYSQQNVYKGTIIESGTNRPIADAKIQAGNAAQAATSNADGAFELPSTQGKQYVTIVADGYQPYEAEIDFNSITDLGTIRLQRISNINQEIDYISEIELDDDISSGQNTSALLSSSKDAFLSLSGFNLGSFRFRQRGYESHNALIYVNGMKLNEVERGQPVFAMFGGLNDAVRNQVYSNGLLPSDETFGALGGTTVINTRASSFRKQIKVSYAAANSQYRHRLMVTAATGMMENNWSVAVSASRRAGNQGYVEATSYDAWAYFLSIEKKINSQHSIAFTAFASPSERGMQNASADEVYGLMENNYYNANWGWQNGEKRNSRMRKSHQPVLTLNHFWQIDEKSNLTTSLGYVFGRDGQYALAWGEAYDPRPDYYRNLPSYFTNPEIKQAVADKFKNDPSVNQINWAGLYRQNTEETDADGKHQAKYIMEDRRNDRNIFSFNTVLNTLLKENISLQAGVEARNVKTKYFKVIQDLLGADYWLDIDKYAKRDYPTNEDYYQSDLNNPNRKVTAGDRFGYNYIMHHTELNLWTLLRMKLNAADIYFGPQLSNTSFYREGLTRTGLFPNNSFGRAQTHNFGNYALKGGFTYKITGRHFIDGNAAVMTRAPFYRNVYLSPRTRDNVMNSMTSEKIASADLSYIVRSPYVQARITGYYTTIRDKTETTSYYDDSYGSYLNLAMRGVNQRYVGIEAGLQWKLSQTTTFEAAFAHGKYEYTNNPLISLTHDATAETRVENEKSYIKGFYVEGTPQTAISAEITYNSPKYWWITFGGNYVANAFLDFSSIKRILSLYENVADTDYDVIKKYAAQIRLPEAFTFHLSGGYSVRLRNNYLQFMFNIQNIFNKKDIKTGGYETMRINLSDIESATFEPRYYYAFGTT